MIIGLLVLLTGAINVLIGLWFIRWREDHLPAPTGRDSSPRMRARMEITLGTVMIVMGLGIVIRSWPA